MSRIIKLLSRIMAMLASLGMLKPAINVHADTGKTYDSKRAIYLITECECFAEMTYQAALLRDTGGSKKQFLDTMKKGSVNDNPERKEDIRDSAQIAADIAYTMTSMSPQELHNLVMTSCIKHEIIRIAEDQGKLIAAVRSCGIDSLQHETLVHDIFQLMTTDATILAAGKKQMQDSIATTLAQITKVYSIIPCSIDEYRQRVCTQERLDDFKKVISALTREKQELLEQNAKDKRNR